MTPHSPWSAPRRRPRRPDWRLTGALVLIALYAFTQHAPHEAASPLSASDLSQGLAYGLAGAGLLLVCAAAATTGAGGALWHLTANVMAEEKERPLRAPWVVDGDTIDDRATGVRYRLANIDAPETGDNAKCFRERQRGELAARVAIQLVRSAGAVAVRRTWRTDRYGRHVAFVLIDGQDLGRILVERGLARPWRGRREPWCGRRGGLARIAETGAMPFACETCRHWR
jgi:endonuclease YncB( thermonuclease family)